MKGFHRAHRRGAERKASQPPRPTLSRCSPGPLNLLGARNHQRGGPLHRETSGKWPRSASETPGPPRTRLGGESRPPEGLGRMKLAIDDPIQGEPSTGNDVFNSSSESMILGRKLWSRPSILKINWLPSPARSSSVPCTSNRPLLVAAT